MFKNLFQVWLHRQTHKPVIAFRSNNFILVRFGIVSSLALLFGLAAFIVLFKELGLENRTIKVLLFAAPINLIVFSFILNFLFYIKQIFQDIRFLKNITFGFFGGLLGVVLSFVLLAKLYGINLLLLFDGSAILVGFIHSFARTACVNYGCCHGREILKYPFESRLHIIYSDPLSKAVRVSKLANKPLYPVQLYESIGCLTIGFVIVFLALFFHRLGLLVGAYLFLYGLLRFVCEFYRGESDTIYFKKLSVYQWICLLLILAGFSLSIYALTMAEPAHISFHWNTLYHLKEYYGFLFVMPCLILFFYGFHYKSVGKWC
jgi:phosphatidylglycerol---prolipoprotein diacylglyceryl transferase